VKAEPDRQAIDAVFRLADSPQLEIRRVAARAASLLGARKPGATSLLARLLTTDPDAEIRTLAARALHWSDASCRQALPALVKALSDRDAAVRVEALEAITETRYRHPSLETPLLRALDDRDVSVQWFVVDALGTCATPSPRVLAALKRLLSSENKELARRADRALKRLNAVETSSLSR
jgi:HEAT repeat protein